MTRYDAKTYVGVEEFTRLSDASLGVGAVQRQSVEVADLGVEGSWEEVVTDAVLWCIDTLASAVLWTLWRVRHWLWRWCYVGLAVSV